MENKSLKVLVLGDKNVGKTSLILHYLEERNIKENEHSSLIEE